MPSRSGRRPASRSLDEEKIEQLETALRSTRLLMQHGNTNYLEVLTAQQTLLDARLTRFPTVTRRFRESLTSTMLWEEERTEQNGLTLHFYLTQKLH